MLAQLQKFEHKKPELVVEWNDSETEARGWLVINSLRGGAAGGGTRMRMGIDFQEVLLAKTMEIGSTRGMGLTRISARSPEAVSQFLTRPYPIPRIGCYISGSFQKIAIQ